MCAGNMLFSSVLLLASFSLMATTVSIAAVYNVTTTSDWPVSPPDYTLRQALNAANENAGTEYPDLINLPPGTYTLTISGPDEDQNLNGDLDVLDNVLIVGKGPDKTFIDGGASLASCTSFHQECLSAWSI